MYYTQHVNNLSTIKKEKTTNTRIPQANEERNRAASNFKKAGKGKKKIDIVKQSFRLRRDEDFKRLFGRGKRLKSSLFKLIFISHSAEFPHIAVIVSRAVARRAVVRNLLRRRAKEWVRTHVLADLPAYDLALIIQKEAVAVSRKQFYDELSGLFKRFIEITRKTT